MGIRFNHVSVLQRISFTLNLQTENETRVSYMAVLFIICDHIKRVHIDLTKDNNEMRPITIKS